MQSCHVLNLHSWKPQTFSPIFIFSSSMEIYQATYIPGLKSFRPTLFQQIFHHLLTFYFSPSCKTITVSLSPEFCLSYFHKHEEKAIAYALALILTFKGKASCMTKTLCSPDQSLTLFLASSISKCQNIFANIRFISAHAKLLPNIIP